MAALSTTAREQLRERIVELVHVDPARSSRSIAVALGTTTATVARARKDIAVEPPANADQAIEQGALRAASCRCDRALLTDGGRCLRCGRVVLEVEHA
jgi:hypothetical protein